MDQEFVMQNYLIIEQNIVTNLVLWNGDTSQWTPPQGSIALIQSTTLAKIWQLNSTYTDWELVEIMGVGAIGFTWDGSVLTTNEPKPPAPVPIAEPVTEGTQTL